MVRVIWKRMAIQHLQDIKAYIATDSKLQTQRVVNKIRSSVRRIKTIGVVVQDLGDPTLREIVVFSYRILYRFVNNEIHIVAVIHCASQLTNEMLEE